MSTWFDGRLRELGYATYDEYLRSAHWQRLRRQFKSRDARCYLCRSRRFELHHRTYERLGCEVIDDLVPLCRWCHKDVHKRLIHARGVELSDAHEWVRTLREKKRARVGIPQAATDRARARKRGREQLRRGG